MSKMTWTIWAAVVAFLLWFGCTHADAACILHDGYAYADIRCPLTGQNVDCEGLFNCRGALCYQATAGHENDYVQVRGFYCGGGNWASCTYYRCSNSDEADSLRCELFPTSAGCIQQTDTILVACREIVRNGQTYADVYKFACKAELDKVVSCAGKTSGITEADGTHVGTFAGTCEQNGYTQGINKGDSNGGAGGASADCWAILGSRCQMRDKRSGNTFMCDCDGSCDAALRNLMTGRCTNPYPQTQSSSSGGFDLSSMQQASSSSAAMSSGGLPASSAVMSSGAEPASSAGYSSEGEGFSDFEYDYTEVLEQIRGNTQFTGTQVERLNEKANTANNLLQEIANKDWSPTINVAAPNVTINGDTAKAPAAILGLLQDKLNGGEPNSNDTAGMGTILSGLMGSIDSAVNEGVPDMSDSLGGAVSSMRLAYGALKDSLNNGPWADSVSKWENTLLNNGVITGNGSDACPAVLQRTWSVSLGIGGNVTFGPLGKYLCAVVPGVGQTFWALARVIIRAVVSILCMMWLFKSVLGIDGGSDDED